MTYEHDALGRVISQTDARGNETAFTYDGFGNLTAKAINQQPHASYTYSYTGATAGLLTSESAGGASVSYTYDAYDRLSTKTYTLTGTLLTNQSLQYAYHYGSNGLLQHISYPGGLNVIYDYDSYGNKIQTSANGTTVWRLDEFDGIGTVVGHAGQLSSGSFLDMEGRLGELFLMNGNTTLADLEFTYDSATGNLLSRESSSGASETFTYDNLDRLTSAGGQTYSYADNGNLTYKTGIGHYTYGNVRPHAVTSIENTDCLMAMSRLDTEYNTFGKISRIHDHETGRSLDILYGIDDERYLSIQRYGDDSIEHEVIYLDGLDLRIDWDGYQKWTYYPEDHVITKKNDSGPFSHYFTFTDQVGSILKAVDANGTVKFSASYDPWGQQTVTTNQIGLIRGYTGHEMLTEYGLINMNGRLYDPLLGRFLSTDNFVQEPGSTQSFNRYSYCLNNPLKYTDPSGDLWWMPVLANICFNVAESCGNHEGLWQGVFKGMATSAISMATSYATMGIGNLFGHSLGGAGTELLRAGTHGLLNGAVNSIEGKNFGAGFASGAIASLAASGAETFGAGYGGMLASSVAGGSIGSGLMGGSWIDGAMTGLRIGSLNHGWRYLNGERVYELDEILVIGHGPNYMSSIHTALDAAGVFLDVADAVNAVLYGLEGDYLNAGLSAAAMVPALGNVATAGKYANKGFKTFNKFKKEFGTAGEGMNWHHIVEQTPSNIQRFGPEMIHNTNNLIRIPGGKGSIHAKISGHYSSKPPVLDGLTVRQWLSTKSFEEQYEYGLNMLNRYGWK